MNRPKPPYAVARPPRRPSSSSTAPATTPSDKEIETIRAIIIGSVIVSGVFIPIWIWCRLQRKRKATP